MERRSPWRGIELWRDEHPSDTELGCEDFLDAPNPFGYEELLAFPSPPAL